MSLHEVITTGPSLAARLSERADRSVYHGRDGNFYIDYQGGRVAQNAIREAYAAGDIKLKWPDRPDLHIYVLK